MSLIEYRFYVHVVHVHVYVQYIVYACTCMFHCSPLGNVAYESSFGPSFIAALDKNDDMRTLHSDVHDGIGLPLHILLHEM